MWKCFYSKGTHKWIDTLDDLTSNYNHTKHRTIMMRPADVNKSNKDQVWVTLYGHIQGDFPIPKFKVDDTVRVSKYNNIFNKGYESNFTEEIFKVFRANYCIKGIPSQLSVSFTKRSCRLLIREIIYILWKRS